MIHSIEGIYDFGAKRFYTENGNGSIEWEFRVTKTTAKSIVTNMMGAVNNGTLPIDEFYRIMKMAERYTAFNRGLKRVVWEHIFERVYLQKREIVWACKMTVNRQFLCDL